MFTGIITATAPVTKSAQEGDGLKLTFKIPAGWEDIELGESIATDGACLTVAEIRLDKGEYDCFLMSETLDKTSFGKSVPAEVNLERSLRAGDRFGGHFVQGHVDGVGKVTKVTTDGGYEIFVEFDPQFAPLMISKGSISMNGCSLTVASLKGNVFSVALIPHTLGHTTLQSLKPGDSVNLEFDMIGKYVTRMQQR